MPELIDVEIQLPDVLALRMVHPPEELPGEMALVIAGPPGPPGGSGYTHHQVTASAVWTVAHNLGRHPSITVVDHLGGQLFPDVRYLDADLAQITHSVPLIGSAYCN